MSQTGFYVGVLRLNAIEGDRTAYDQLEPQVIPVVVSVAVAGKELLWEGAQVTLCAKPSLPPSFLTKTLSRVSYSVQL